VIGYFWIFWARRWSMFIVTTNALTEKGILGKLKAEEILLGAKILAVADAFDAMTTDRPYQKGRPT
jgi:hypothetical protein